MSSQEDSQVTLATLPMDIIQRIVQMEDPHNGSFPSKGLVSLWDLKNLDGRNSESCRLILPNYRKNVKRLKKMWSPFHSTEGHRCFSNSKQSTFQISRRWQACTQRALNTVDVDWLCLYFGGSNAPKNTIVRRSFRSPRMSLGTEVWGVSVFLAFPL